MRWLAILLVLAVALAVTSGLWLPLPGTLLADVDPPAPADAALVLDGTGSGAMDGAERWRRDGLVQRVVVVEAPVRTHALVTYWTDLVARGLARPSPTPPEWLSVVRADRIAARNQGAAALPTLQALGVRSVLVPGGGLGSRLTRRELNEVLGPAGVTVHLVRATAPDRDPARWYANAFDRRAVLGNWLGLLVPVFVEGGQGSGE